MNSSEKLLKNILGQQKSDKIVSKRCIPNDNYDKIKSIVESNNSVNEKKKDNINIVNMKNKVGIATMSKNSDYNTSIIKLLNDEEAIETMVNYLKDREDYMEVLSKIIYEINKK